MDNHLKLLIKEIKTLTIPSNQYDRRDMIEALNSIFNFLNKNFPDIKVNKNIIT